MKKKIKNKKDKYFPKGSAMEGLRMPTAADAKRAAKRLIKAFGKK